MTAPVAAPIRATCPDHGPQVFIRDELGEWAVCPQATDERGRIVASSCRAVILDEHLTPDGADVTRWAWAR